MLRLIALLALMSTLLAAQALDPRQKERIDRLADVIERAPQLPVPRFVNPFVPPAQRAPTRREVVPPPQLHSIMGERALINGRWVSAGELVAGYQVTQVAPDAVYLERGGRTVRVTIAPLTERQILNKTESP